MNALLLPLLTVLILGILIGLFAVSDDSSPSFAGNSTSLESKAESGAFKVESDTQRIKRLEAEITKLKQRIESLERQPPALALADEALEEEVESEATIITNPDPLNQDNLIRAGVSNEIANDIMNRISEQEYKRLQLRDLAIREDYFRTGRYYKELRQLNENNLSLREEIGDEAYDRYLYQTGQNNRVKVSTIMINSPAEQAGMQNGDIILRYNNEKIFKWNEVRQATSKGQLGEYVTVDVIRDGELLSLMIPRGPMGVKLDTTRYQPLNNQ